MEMESNINSIISIKKWKEEIYRFLFIYLLHEKLVGKLMHIIYHNLGKNRLQIKAHLHL